MRIYLLLLLPCLTLNLKSPQSSEFGKRDTLTRSSSLELGEKRRANVMEGGRDPANVILRQRRLKVRRTGKRSGEPGEDEEGRMRGGQGGVGEGRARSREPGEDKEGGQPKLPSAAHATEVKPKRTDNTKEEKGEMRWESLKMYLPSNSFRLDKARRKEREMLERKEANKNNTNQRGVVAGTSLISTEKRTGTKEKMVPQTKETSTIVGEPLDPVKRISSETGKIVLPPLLLLPLVKEIGGERKIKRRRLEAPAPFRRNTKAILKVRLNEKPKRKGEMRKNNVLDQENTTTKTISQVTPVTIDLPNLTLRRKGIRRVKKRKKKSKEPPSSSSNLAEERNQFFSVQKKKINRAPQVPSNCREGKKLRKDIKDVKKERSEDSKNLATWQTEDGQRLLESVRQALLAAYAMAFATTGTSPTHYRGATMMLGSS